MVTAERPREGRASVEWRRIPTVLRTDEILDKAFRRASKQPDTVEDPDKYHRVRKQMNKMVQSAASVIDSTLIAYVEMWPSLNALSSFDQALVEAAVGSENIGGPWGLSSGQLKESDR